MPDTDHDGLSDELEVRLGTDPKKFDTDGDGFGDGSEIAQHKNPLHKDANPTGYQEHPHQATADDPDADGLDEMQEHLLKTDPNNFDTDGDGLSDFVESIGGTDPLKPDPTPTLSGSPSGAGSGTADPPAPTAPTTGQGTIDPDVELLGASARNAFLEAAKAQIGDPYKFGAETDLNDPDPKAFDSSELVQWAAAQAGVKIPDGSWKQYQFLHEHGGAMSVQDALKTPGALVFGFSSDPLASDDRPARAYVAISLGNGKVLDVSERSGEVKEMDPGNFYTYAAGIPQMMEDLDSDGDQLWDIDERVLGTNPFDPSDGPYAPSKGATPTDTTDPSTDVVQPPGAGATDTPSTDTPADTPAGGTPSTDAPSADTPAAGTTTDPAPAPAPAPADDSGPVTHPYQVDDTLPGPDAASDPAPAMDDPAPAMGDQSMDFATPAPDPATDESDSFSDA
jgi:thrombospondin type 3 repeat protein/NlpC/P60 family protein